MIESILHLTDWSANTVFTAGQLVRYPATVGVVNVSLPEVYSVTANFTSGATFDPKLYKSRPNQHLMELIELLTYTPEPKRISRELAQVMTGIDYPETKLKVRLYKEYRYDKFELIPLII